MRSFVKFLNEVALYSDDPKLTDEEREKYDQYNDDGNGITVIRRDDYHQYEYLDGVLYELSGRDDRIVSMDSITAMEENPKFDSQIEKYKDYIREGGILQTLEVHHIKPSVREFLEKMYDDFDSAYEFAEEHKMDYDDLTNLLDDYYDALPSERDDDPRFIDLEDKVEKYIDSNEDLHEFNLRDHHHRFWALDSLGIKNVYVEVIEG